MNMQLSCNTKYMIKITFKLKELRLKKSITIRQLAMMSGVSKSQISDIETGKSMPTILTLCQLAEALHVEPEELYIFEKRSSLIYSFCSRASNMKFCLQSFLQYL